MRDEYSFSRNAAEMRNMSEVETAEAKYRIVYAVHNRPSNPKILDGVDAVILENIDDYSTKEKASDVIFYLWLMDPEGSYRQTFVASQKQGQPVFLVDLSAIRKEDDQEFVRRKALLPALEFMLGGLLFGSEILDATQTKAAKKVSRRDLLKKGTKILLGAYFILPLTRWQRFFLAPDKAHEETDEKSLGRRTEKMLTWLNHKIHPELRALVIDTRNDLIAQKAERVGKILRTEKKRKPTIAIIIGTDHFGLEDSLRSDKSERVERLREELGEDFSRQGRIARVDFVGEKQEMKISILHDPAFS